jgi:putative CocE/NonD family hydrolase
VIAWLAGSSPGAPARRHDGQVLGRLQCAADGGARPPALKAIITVCSTDDRYADDIHFMGGACSTTICGGARSCSPIRRARPIRRSSARAGATNGSSGWTCRSSRRCGSQHQRRDDYWKHGSICEDFSAIQCPVFAVGGWADAYTNAMCRACSKGCRCRGAALIGPWAHIYPQDGVPAPAIGFLQEALRWWDHWLKDDDRGVMAEPMLRAFVEDWMPPAGTRAESEGRWVGEAAWPSPAIAPRRWALNAPGSLDGAAAAEADILVRSPLSHGKASGEWMATGCPGELPVDQRLDDGAAQLFDTAPLAEAVEILGAPELLLDLAVDAPVAQVAVRLCDVAPDGRSTRVSYGVLNLTHRDGHEAPAALEPGKRYPVRLKLNDCGHRFPAGHRIRIAVASGYWPIVWPAPTAATLTLRAGASHLDLPVRRGGKQLAVDFAPPLRGR